MITFGGSSNDTEILTDDENRRFWCVMGGSKFNLELLKQIREQLWAEALAEYKHAIANFSEPLFAWCLTSDENKMLQESNVKFEVRTSLELYLEHLFSDVEKDLDFSLTEITQKWMDHRDVGQKYTPKQVSKALEKLGWTKYRGGKRKDLTWFKKDKRSS